MYTTAGKIFVWIRVELDFLPKIPNCSLHSQLGVVETWAYADQLRNQVGKSMDGLSSEMDTLRLEFAIKQFKLIGEFN